ncbi:MAG: hypothetical protein ACRC33_09790 [Gemmataceae bacterium]
MSNLLGPPRPPEIASLTALRGGLALWVVVFHFWNDILKLFPGMSPLTPVGVWQIFRGAWFGRGKA